jgi:hypothetical protein
MLSKELVAASTKPLVLAILAQGESYGYELIRRVRELSGDRIQWSEGMLYRAMDGAGDPLLVDGYQPGKGCHQLDAVARRSLVGQWLRAGLDWALNPEAVRPLQFTRNSRKWFDPCRCWPRASG